ncbi:MAG: TonB-dependent hemoglobin/transferrin/lactoferrin family receptor [Hyphomicrobiaceae bacterium]
MATQTTGQTIRRDEIGSITDLGNATEPGVEYSSRTDGPSIRGLEGPRVTTVIDGIPVPFLEDNIRSDTAGANSPTNADGGGAAFDFFSISALDVLRGSDSSRIGPGAMGGAIVIRTLEPDDLLEKGRDWGGLSKVTYDGRDGSIAGGIAIASRAGPVSVLLQGSYKDGNEMDSNGKDGSFGARRTKPNPLDYDQDNVLFKLRLNEGSGHRFGITAERYKRDADAELMTNWNRSFGPTGYAPGNYLGHDGVERRRTSFDYSYRAMERGLVDTAFATAYWQDLTKYSGADGWRRNNSFYDRNVAMGQETLGFVGGMTGTVATGSLAHKWRIGMDMSTFRFAEYTTVVPASPFGNSQADIPKVNGDKFGIYIEDRLSFVGSRFAVTPGVRLDWHRYKPVQTEGWNDNSGSGVFDFPGENSATGVAPKVLGTYQAARNVEFFAQWSASYRAPTVSELYSNFTNPVTGYASLGNPGLDPERGQGVEVGANAGDKDFGGRVAVFYNWYRNFILQGDLQPDPGYPFLPFGVARYENVEDVKIGGVEVRGHKKFRNGIRLHGALAYTYGEDGEGNMLPTVAPIKGIVGIGYEAATWGVDLTGIFVGKYRDNFDDPTRVDSTFDAPSYAVANLAAWWEPAMFKGMRIQASVKNLFDETYYEALSVRTVNLSSSGSQPMEFYSAPGRNFLLSLTQKF